ncbi:MAG TPA: hypothetical protein VGH89_19620 [Pseudonocardia sp.]
MAFQTFNVRKFTFTVRGPELGRKTGRLRRGARTEETNVALLTPDASNATFISSEFAATTLNG